VAVAPGEESTDEEFVERLGALNEEFEALNVEARQLETAIASNIAKLLADRQ
jgi:type I restriction enzyme M protein